LLGAGGAVLALPWLEALAPRTATSPLGSWQADLIFPLGEEVAGQISLSQLTRSVVMSDHFRYRRLAPAL
jgi:hypothetical protein